MNKLIHEQSRLKILTLLATGKEAVPFTTIRDNLAMTGGNLSVQLKTLEEAGLVATEKYFSANKPRTDVTITQSGRDALMEYLEELESLLAELRRQTK
jgi:DNA-binding MarR family transcriptional regulator